MKSKHPGRVSRVNPYVHARARLWDTYRIYPAYPALPCRKPITSCIVHHEDEMMASTFDRIRREVAVKEAFKSESGKWFRMGVSK